MLKIRLRFSYFFLTFISLFSLVVYLTMFNTNNERHFLTYMFKNGSTSVFPSFNLSMFTEEDYTTINKEDSQEF